MPTIDDARRVIGVSGRADTVRPFRAAVADSGSGFYPLVALALFYAIDEGMAGAFNVLAPEMGAALGLSIGAAAQLALQRNTGFLLASLQFAGGALRRPRRRLFTVAIPIQASVLFIVCSVTTTPWLVWLAGGLTVVTAPTWAFHRPMLMDYYPPDIRVRTFAIHRAGGVIGMAVGTLGVVLMTSAWGLTWRGAFLVLGALSLVLSVIASRIKDPPLGRFDTDRVRTLVRSNASVEDTTGSGDKLSLGFFEAMRRLFLIPTIVRILAAMAVLGTVLYPLNTFLAFHLQERWSLGVSGRGLFFAGAGLLALPALVAFGSRGDALFAADPARLVRVAARLMFALAALLLISPSLPVLGLAVVAFGFVSALAAVLTTALAVILLSILRPYFRPTASALSGLFLIGIGGQVGALLLAGIDRRYGTTTAIMILAGPAAIGGWMLMRASRTVNQNLDQMLSALLEDEEVSIRKRSGDHISLLSCRQINFYYGQLQVLFDVNFTVDDGEMVALLGTNGAGKSTLLRVISGLGMPSSGTVYFRGEDVTYVDAERRLALSGGHGTSEGREMYDITQVPGGRAVFPQMTVLENLKVYGFALGRDRKTLDRSIDRCFEVFPALYERRRVKAVNLSGGQQQMLALCKAFILKPRVLLIDELSLGLAPILVGQLLEMVKVMNAEGSAVVLVEQSVNIALSLVHHAYFMERGQIRFDGKASELAARDDLLRAVFLEGTAAAPITQGGRKS